MNQFDFQILKGLTQFAGRWPAFDQFVGVLVNADSFKGGLLMAVLWWVWFRRAAEPLQQRRIVLATLAGGMVAVIMARALSMVLPFRLRPVLLDPAHTPANPAWFEWTSFPSDHATLFCALATSLGALSPRLAAGLLAYTGVVICLPRMYVGLHYPTDILAGVVLGTGVGAIMCRPRIRNAVARPALRWLSQDPASFYCALFVLTYQLATLFADVRHLGRAAIRILGGH